VKLTGYIPEDDLPYLYAAAEVFVFPSLYEGFGLPVLEAMAAGCPVIASNASSIKEIVGNSGLRVDPQGAIEEWSSAIARLASSSDLRESLRGNGLARARQFSWETCAESTLNVCRSALS
jgi:alpha-1,3-rhamnosyl/mannosyltransferase